jgi:hypothetical protein
MDVKVPKQIRSDNNGFYKLLLIFNEIKDVKDDTINIDFGNCEWFEANLCAVMGAICYYISSNRNKIELHNLSPDIDKIFKKNEFLRILRNEPTLFDIHKTTVKYRRFESRDHIQFAKYLDTELFARQDIPQMSVMLQKKINESIYEIFENAVTHGDCDNIFSCGQCYPQFTPPKLDFTIVDLGRTIKLNVNEYLDDSLTGVEAIKWAVKEMNTTKKGHTPGGLGLKLIREFLQINKGIIQIVSADGYWQQGNINSIFVREYSINFPGTIVNLEFNIDAKNYYYLSNEKQELNEGDIF